MKAKEIISYLAIITVFAIACITLHKATHTVTFLHGCGYSKAEVLKMAIDPENINNFQQYGL